MSTTAPSTKASGSKALQKPDPAAVVAKTEVDHHTKAESLRRTNEKIENIEKCIATDTGAEVEIERIILQEKESMKKDEEEMKKSKDQKRQHHIVELEQLIKEQAVKHDELKPAEKALYVELAQKLSGYQQSLFRANNVTSFDSEEDYDTEEKKYKARSVSATKATTNGRAVATVSKVGSASSSNKGKKRTLEVVIEKEPSIKRKL